MKLKQHLDSLKKSINLLSDKDRAQKNKEYLKSPLSHKGLRAPQMRKISKTWIQDNKDLSKEEIQSIAKELWNSKIHEERSLALYILEYRSEDLNYTDLEFLENMTDEATDWSHVDQIGVNLVGSILEKDSTGLLFLPVWATATNVWVRRLSIISQIRLFRKGKGNMSVFSDVVKAQLSESDDWTKEERFFIRKAIGWTLRERSKANPESVVKFINLHGRKMNTLSFREATRNLKPGYRKMIIGNPPSRKLRKGAVGG